MALIILGVIILILSAVLLKGSIALQKFIPAGRIIGFIFIALGIITSCVKQIDGGEIGVKVLFGSIQNDIMGSGLHFINPLLDVKKLDHQ